jgi:integrase
MPKRPRSILPHLQRDRFGTYYFRLTVAGKTLRRSLHTKDKSLATMLGSKLNWEWSMTQRQSEPTVAEILKAFKKDGREFDAEFPDGTKLTGIESDDDLRRAKELMLARIEAIGPIEPHLAPLRPEYRTASTDPKPNPFKGRGKRFLAAVVPYLDEMEGASVNKLKTREDKQATYDAFAAQFANPVTGDIDKAMAVAFKQAQLATAGPGRVNTKIGQLSEFFKWAIGNGEADVNHFEGIRISKKSKLMEKVQSYEPFTEDDLAAIFNPATYPAYATAGKPHFKWLPFLLCYTGARPDELASLRLDQIRQEQGIDFIALKAAKNSNSIRKIPLHHVVRSSGFMAYLAQRRIDDPDGQLFPLLRPSKNGYSKNVSRRFNESYLPTLRIDEPTKRLYSFRATFITRMTELNVNTAMVMALVGHFEQDALDLSSPHFKNYQGAKRIAALRDTIDMFDITLPMAF